MMFFSPQNNLMPQFSSFSTDAFVEFLRGKNRDFQDLTQLASFETSSLFTGDCDFSSLSIQFLSLLSHDYFSFVKFVLLQFQQLEKHLEFPQFYLFLMVFWKSVKLVKIQPQIYVKTSCME
ncbi:hypothetical protein KI387_029502, partial [Taxus chinensis]